ncbi:zinc finger protein 28-like [Drosophila sulfurigaster albostrigata]|uniref:zinc finger protein 28-like n=1 Tax=Drosophila sulfurigaster albostrigata TaxID=89887 RepID=UPI002D21E74E|nr:zinc finger protein 28-like [Drosophila sulfurigaster albostrigata]
MKQFIRHGGKNQLFCQCGRYYHTESRLRLHQQDECEDLRRYQCDICLKWFKRRSHVNRHKKLHTNSKQWQNNKTNPAPTTRKTKAKKSRTSSVSSAFDPMDLNPTNLRQLASISTARSLQHLVPHLPQNLHIDTSSLVPGRKLPRQSSKRTPPYESNRCPLCARVYRSQAFLNEHMRKEHSVLI